MSDNFKYYLFCIYVFVKGYVHTCIYLLPIRNWEAISSIHALFTPLILTISNSKNHIEHRQ